MVIRSVIFEKRKFSLSFWALSFIRQKSYKLPQVLIVQASAYTKYIGDLTVYFDIEGEISSWEGKPIYLDSDVEKGNAHPIGDY